MLRYIALVWNAANPTHRHAANALVTCWKSSATKWQETPACDGLCVLHAAESPEHSEVHRLQDQNGVVFGTLFKHAAEADTSEATPVHGALDRTFSEQVVSTGGRKLIDSYWGSYIGLFRDKNTGTTSIIRSPMGFLPCLKTEYHGVRIFFSSMPDCTSNALLRFSINWQYLARHLAKFRQSGDTGLNEVSEVLYGECVEVSRDCRSQQVHQHWNALDVARRQSILSPVDAITRTREVVRRCVHAWAACQKTVVHRLSGGLDSSIILGCLRDAPSRPHVVCVNRYSHRSDSDEREYARLAAQHTGFELLELERNATFRLEDIFNAQPAERPQNYILQFSQILPEAQLAYSRSAGAIFDGSFGDQLFYAFEYPLTVADYVSDFGIRPSLLPVVVSAARAGNLSVWNVLRASLLKGLLNQRWDPVSARRETNVLMNEDVLRNLLGTTSDTHRWYARDKYVPVGKQLQISLLMDAIPYHMPFGDIDHLRYVSPLLSQPLVELCLSIPTYVLSHGGWDREIERRAFTSDIPARIIRRRTKGGQADFSSDVKRHNLALIRDLLMNGWLVESGLLDRGKLQQALDGHSAGLDAGPARLSRVLNIEVWLKTCAASTLRAAA